MHPYLPLEQSFQLALLVALFGGVFLRFLLRSSWRQRSIRIAYALVCAALLVAHGAWAVSGVNYAVSFWGMATASVGLLFVTAVVASLPAAALLRAVMAWALLRKKARGTPEDGVKLLPRRAVVTAVTALAPAAAAATVFRGFSEGQRPTAIRTVPVVFPKLHPDLEGFRILQLSDLHLGPAKQLADLELLFEQLDTSEHRPDLIVFTGDVADDVRQLGPALALAHQFRAAHGVLASLGNHEYIHDIRVTRPIYDRSPVPLLVDEGAELRVGDARLYVGGANDPVIIRADIHPFLEGSVERAMRGSPSDAFRLLLSHRPDAFDIAARRGIELTLSGHTHGGQIGANGKSAFEPLWPDGYLWGGYGRGGSRLYTTAGFGNWFPFRVGCPTEAPLIVLSSARGPLLSRRPRPRSSRSR
ncbi:metallophosphoesterase [Pendulispora albinea]|uniref:Metallophosphoesterase n=1 Tax=Pendulispora albinea TaxID=2741071 RepID=A0ABZ2LPG8_9BACT